MGLKKLNKMQIASIFIAVIMLLSIFGFAISLSFKNSTQKTTDSNTETKATVQKLYSADINAEVVGPIEEAIVFFKTDSYNIADLDNEIKSLNSVSLILKSNFFKDQNQTTYYTANVKIKGDVDDFVKEVSDKNYNYYFLSDIKFENPVLLKNDSNEELQYDFGYNRVKAILLPNTRKGDKIKAKLSVLFLGNKPSNMQAEELQNYSTALKTISLDMDLEPAYSNSVLLFADSNSLFDKVKTRFNKIEIINNDENSLVLRINDPKPAFIEDLMKNYDINFYKEAEVHITDIFYKGKKYTYDKNISLRVPYNYDSNLFTITALVQRNNILFINAEAKQ